MILCAGLGSRLKPWTDSHPKALVPVAGVPMLKRVAERLAAQGFDELTVNVHHFSDQVISYIKEDEALAMKTAISDESAMLLDTGGGLLNAAGLLARDSRPFLVHNVDILSDADLHALMDSHIRSGRHVTLLVSDRKSDRKLVFDSFMALKGWVNTKSGETRPSSLQIDASDRILSFSGIYVMSPEVLGFMSANGFNGAFPVMDFFLAGLPGLSIGGLEQTGLELIDIGKPDALHRANLIFQ